MESFIISTAPVINYPRFNYGFTVCPFAKKGRGDEVWSEEKEGGK
jgi:hypothetical protein